MTREVQIELASGRFAYMESRPACCRASFEKGCEWADANRWVKVEDGLPDKPYDCHVILAYKRDNEVWSAHTNGIYNGEIWLIKTSKGWDVLDDESKVLCYSPFPSPPKAEQ